MCQMPPSILLRVEHPPVECLWFDAHLHTALFIGTHARSFGPWGSAEGADLDEVEYLTLGEVVGVGFRS